MAGTNPKISRRKGSSKGQFKQRVPTELLAKARGKSIKFVFEAMPGADEWQVDRKVGEWVEFSLGTKNPIVEEERKLIAKVQYFKFLRSIDNETIELDQSIINNYARKIERFKNDEYVDNSGLPNLQKTVGCLIDLDQSRMDKLKPIWRFNEWETGPFDICQEPLPRQFKETADTFEAMDYRVGYLVNWWLCENDITLTLMDRERLVRCTDTMIRDIYNGLAIAGTTTTARPSFTANAISSKQSKHTLTEVFHHWVLLKKTRSPNSIKSWRSVVRRLKRSVGHEQIADITPEDLIRWKDGFTNSMTFNRTHLIAARRLFSLAADEGWITNNPARGIMPIEADGEDDGPRPYVDYEVSEILSMIVDNSNPAIRWIPLLVILTGARVREIAQLHASQVKPDKAFPDIWSITISDKLPYQQLKIKGRRHVIPLHPSYIKEDFYEFVHSREGRYLFADPDPNRVYNTSPFQTAMDQSRKWIQSVYKDDDPPDTHHGFRKWFKTKAFSVTTDHDCVQYIQGHERTYSKRKYRPHPFQDECLVIIEAVFNSLREKATQKRDGT